MAIPATSYAWDPFGPETVDCDSGGKQAKSAVCKDPGGDPLAGPDGLLIKLTNIVAYIAGIAAIIMIIISGINFMTASGDPAKVSSARSSLTNAIIGLVVIIMAKAIITYVVVRL